MNFYIATAVLIFVLNFRKSSTASSTYPKCNYNVNIPKPVLRNTPIAIAMAPYQVSLHMRYLGGNGAGAFCGGAAISQRMIITAASCIFDYSTASLKALPATDLMVVMGTAYVNETDKNTLKYVVQKVVPHSNWMYDIGAVFIDGYIPWNWPTVRAVQLNTKEVPLDTVCTSAGWEMQMFNSYSSVLMASTLPIMNATECGNLIGFSNVTQSMLCAGYPNFGGVESCSGGAGDALVCNGYLTGVLTKVSCSTYWPNFYMNVSDFYDWIIQTNASFDYNSYNGGRVGAYVCSNAMIFLSIFLGFLCYI